MNATTQVRCATILLVITVGGAGDLRAGAPRHEVRIEAVCRAHAQDDAHYSYLIRPSRPTFDERSLRHKEAVAHLRTALSGRGLFEAPVGVRPDLIIEFDYGLGPVRTVYVETREPIYETMGGERVPPPAGASSSGMAAQRPDGAPQAWLVGYTTVRRPVLVRDKYLVVTARTNVAGNAEPRALPPLWRVSARIEDSSGELRRYLPVLAAAIMDQAGATTEGNVAMKMADNSDDVAFIRRGL